VKSVKPTRYPTNGSHADENDLPPELAQPALRALHGAGIRRLEPLTTLTENRAQTNCMVWAKSNRPAPAGHAGERPDVRRRSVGMPEGQKPVLDDDFVM